jgi:hypothetical protein
MNVYNNFRNTSVEELNKNLILLSDNKKETFRLKLTIAWFSVIAFLYTLITIYHYTF